DLDGNGMDDLVLPLSDGYRVYFQTAPGVFGRTSTLESGLPAETPRELSAAAYVERTDNLPALFTSTVDLPRLQAVHINGDGLKDLVLIRKDEIVYFLQQKETGLFPSQKAYRFTRAVTALKDEIKKDSANLTMVRFADINQDGIADLIVTKIEGTLGLWDS